MAGNRGKADPMAGLLSGLGGINPNLFNKPTMGQLKNKQQSPTVSSKPVTPAPKSDTIAAVGSPSRPDAVNDSFSSQSSTNNRVNPEPSGRSLRSLLQSEPSSNSRSAASGMCAWCQVFLYKRLLLNDTLHLAVGAVTDDLDSFFGSAKPSAAPSQANSYAPSPANMASPAVSLGIPDNQQDSDFFGSFGSPAQPSARPSAQQTQHAQHQQPAVDPFDLFGEGSTMPASAAAATSSQPAPTDDGLFGDVEGHSGEHIKPHLLTAQTSPAFTAPSINDMVDQPA